MTALTLPPRRLRDRHGLTWSVLRVHRTALWVWAAVVAAGVGGLLWSYRQATGNAGDGLPLDDFAGLRLAGSAILLLPPVVAAFAGGALIGRELENGTAALAWTQSVSPARWLAAKLAVPALALTAGMTVLTLLFRWVWTSGTSDAAPGWYEKDVFFAGGPVGLAYVLLGLALGALSGLLMRRTLSGLGFAFFATVLVHFTLVTFRSRLWPTTRWTGFEAARLPASADRIEVGLVTAAGKPLSGTQCNMDVPREFEQCLRDMGAADAYAVVHPASHYWPLQFVESGIVLAVAALACVAAFGLLRRRAA
ncbi:ABC transporter permease [Streptomyces sp. NPDC088354]|uniref:ABC transporter permease n=1 Tax=unclassified Streptomyces TaxID=2593676 RepID=UPI0029BF90C5|nr:ABC transporter permease [Streptomyces sp. MI02-7b]MDX3075116.1 ABC transporter permease [Streptomyces sp. MI02-7b]